MLIFLYGTLFMSCVFAAMIFLRFNRVTKDRLFIFFALAFAAFALNWAALAFTEPGDDGRYQMYILRFSGFVFIILAILDKNRRSKR